MELKTPVGFAHRGFFSVETPDMFKLNWLRLCARPQRSPEAAEVDTRVVASVSAAVAVPARERPCRPSVDARARGE